MSAGRHIPARTISEAKVCRKRCGGGELNARGSAMVAEQGAQSRSAHTGSTCSSFQHDQQCGAAGIGSFQSQIVIEQLNAFWRKREEAKFVAFATNAELRFRQQHV